MSELPAGGFFTDPGTTNATAKTAQDDMLACAKETPGGAAESELTIAAGVVTPTRAAHTVDTESDAASDDLANILTTNHPEGRLLLLRLQDAARVVTVKHQAGGAGQVHLMDAADLALAVDRCLLLQRRGTDWHEVRPWPAATTSREGGVKIAGAAKAKALTDPAPAVSPADLAAVIADHGAWPGCKNAIINGCMRVKQRANLSLSAAGYYFGAVDRWAVTAAGTVGAGTATQVADSDFLSGYCLHFSGVTLSGGGGAEAVYARTRIESRDVQRFINKTCSLSVRIKHDVGTACNALLVVRKANAQDNFSAVTEIASATVSIPSGVATLAKLEGMSLGSCGNGVEVEVKLTTGAITTKNIKVGEVQLEVGTVCTNVELRPFAQELALCQRYFDKSYELATAPGTSTLSGCMQTTYRNFNRFYDQSLEKFKQRMRTAPTVTVYSTQTGASGKCSDLSSDYTATVQNLSERGFFIICGYPTADTEIYWQWAADAEL